ncbi:ANTAR domain-containing protein [Streptomyces sp. NBC_01476]|uniref:ANTAR domain-containing protein n=1 Tax=Streptomyces sp. NBC_01476 TaxID=2903881 RepID=UPI002E3582B6|nr:ANTAR domain-containing protein [Streptomyces sp. NBC_01476]
MRQRTPGDLCGGASAPEREAPRAEVACLREEATGLRRALESYPVIDMARGVIMATAPCTKEQAWQLLVEVSQHANVKVRDVARSVVDGVSGTPLPPEVHRALVVALRRVRAARGT